AKRAVFPSLTHPDSEVRNGAFNAIRERELAEPDVARLAAMAGDGPIDAIVKLVAPLPALPASALGLLLQSLTFEGIFENASEYESRILIWNAFRRLGGIAVGPLDAIAGDASRPEFQRCAALGALGRITSLPEAVVTRL